MFVTAAAGILAAAAVPSLTSAVERSRTLSAARYLAERLAFARTQAVARSANVALMLTPSGDTSTLAIYVDGNGNGVRTREAGAIDRLLSGPVRFATMFPHVTVSTHDPADPPATETTTLMSFTPLGTASSGTLYVRGRDGSQYAVRVLGATGRTRVLRYDSVTRAWVEVW